MGRVWGVCGVVYRKGMMVKGGMGIGASLGGRDSPPTTVPGLLMSFCNSTKTHLDNRPVINAGQRLRSNQQQSA